VIWEILIFTLFALLLGALVWWMWQQRELARRQSETTAELAALGKGIRALAHDLRLNLEMIVATTQRARLTTPGELPEVLGGLEQAARGAVELVRTLGGEPQAEAAQVASAEGVVRLGVILLRSAGVPLELHTTGTLRFLGPDSDALRVVQNLLSNAVREAAWIAGGHVRIEIGDGRLLISNPVRDPALLDDRIYQEGVSYAGSAGVGLSTATQAAARVGWSLRHEVRDGEVCFFVEERAEALESGGALRNAL